MCTKFLQNEICWRGIQILLAVAGIIVAGIFAFQQNNISERLLGLEETSREPVLLIYFDDVVLDKSGNFSGKVHFQNVGSVPVYNIVYQVSNFSTSTSLSTIKPYKYFDDLYKGKLHQFNFHLDGVVIAPGKEISELIKIGNLETSDAIPMIWAGIIFNRYPTGPKKCVEMTYIPLQQYQELPNPSRECGPWWPDFEIQSQP